MKKQIDYSKVPEHVFQKAWNEFLQSNNQIEEDLKRVRISLDNLEKLDEQTKANKCAAIEDC